MVYKYCENKNFEDLASGKVIAHKSGYPNFYVNFCYAAIGNALIAVCVGSARFQ